MIQAELIDYWLQAAEIWPDVYPLYHDTIFAGREYKDGVPVSP